MKRLHTGIIVLDALDIICLSFIAGGGLVSLAAKYKDQKREKIGEDPIIRELKAKSPVIAVSIDGKPLEVPMVRGGSEDDYRLKVFSILIKNKKLAALLKAVGHIRHKQKQARLLQIACCIFNNLLSDGPGIRIAMGGALGYTQVIILIIPSMFAGFLVQQVIPFGVMLPIGIMYYRGIDEISNPLLRCKIFCEHAEEWHNQELFSIKMQKINSLVQSASDELRLPLDKVSLVCVEEKLSLLQRYKLRQVINDVQTRKRVQHFNEFIKKFGECDPDPLDVYNEIVEKLKE